MAASGGCACGPPGRSVRSGSTGPVRFVGRERRSPRSKRRVRSRPVREYGRRVLVGREPERARLESLIEQARHGSAGCLVLRGEPGVGKSALLDAVLAERPATPRCCAPRGSRSRPRLPFAALHAAAPPGPAPACRSSRHPRPEPWASAFGEEDGPGVEPFLVAVATLSVLTAAAEENLVCASSTTPTGSTPRRRKRCCSARGGWGRPRGHGVRRPRGHRVDLRPARASRAGHDRPRPGGGPRPPRSSTRWRTRQRRSPSGWSRRRAATRWPCSSCPASSAPDQLQGSLALPAQLHLTRTSSGRSSTGAVGCRRRSQTMLLLAAADDTGDPAVLRRASTALGVGRGRAASSPGKSGLLSADRETRRGAPSPGAFGDLPGRHGSEDRRRAHQALAEALAGVGDPDRETWHRAAAAEGPDHGRGRGPRAASGHARCGAAATSRRWRRYERAAALCRTPRSAPA